MNDQRIINNQRTMSNQCIMNKQRNMKNELNCKNFHSISKLIIKQVKFHLQKFN